MEIMVDQEKSKTLTNNNKKEMNLVNNNNNPIKDLVKDSGDNSPKESPSKTGFINNPTANVADNSSSSPIFGSPTVSETIYEFGSHFENPSHVVSEKVQNLASQIYNELQKILNRCNDDEDTVGGLMPLIVNVLESLDLALIENQQLQVDLELCKDDNEQLVQAFEKEKQHKKKFEQRLLEYEFSTEEEKQHYQQRIDSLANIVKMLELKAKNSSDHSSRLEEKESEMKKEYSKLHERYTELLRSHCDLMERVKIMFGTDDNANSSNNSKDLQSNISNLASTFRSNLQKFSNDENNMDNYDLTGIGSNEPTESMPIINHPVNPLSSSIPRQTWMEAEMSYDDTTTIIEDVEELQKDNGKDNRDQSLSGKSVHPSEYSSANVTDNFFGMEKEIENLITENNELLATKNALNIVKDDLIAKVDELQSDLAMCKNEIQQREAVQDRLKSRITQLEDEIKKNKDELEETQQKLASLKEDDEEGVPMAQRKRFTRVEMSRVLMERNSYKEKYFELQEALKWSELSRATKNEDKPKSVIWKIGKNISGFSSFFAPSPTMGTIDRNAVMVSQVPNASPAIRYSANPTATPALEAMRRRARVQQNGDLELMMDSDLSSERARAMKNLKSHITRTGNGDRIQAYGWSITGNSNSGTEANKNVMKSASVPVPIYCRPLGGEDIGMKIWCATAVDLSGGEAGFPNTGDGDSKSSESIPNKDSLAVLESEIDEAIREQAQPTDQQYSSFVWICSVSHSKSKVTIVNIRSNPGEVLDSFFIKTHLLCIASAPGARASDFLGNGEVVISEDSPELYLSYRKEKPFNDVSTTITFSSPVPSIQSDNCDTNSINAEDIKQNADNETKSDETSSTNSAVCPLSTSSGESGTNVTLEKLTEYVAYTQPPSPTSSTNDGDISSVPEGKPAHTSLPLQSMSTRLPTMWLGGQNGVLYVHSGIAQWSHCIATIHLSDSILHIVHFRGRVFVALANGQCCIFFRCEQTGEWNFDQYCTLDLGIYSSIKATVNASETKDVPQQTNAKMALYSIRCLEIVKDTVWMGYRNLIFIVNTRTFKVIHSFAAHPRKETYVRHLAALGDGVWCSFRLDSTLRLYSAFKPYQHVQTVDIEPYVTKMVMPKSFNFVRITALKASNNRLWIGTSNGVILCLPLRPEEEPAVVAIQPNSSALNKKVTTTESTGSLTLSTFMPLCDVSTIQLSFHGHKDNVKFFVCTNNLILSGGEGYIDFRINNINDAGSLSKGDRSHLIVWEINS